MVKDQSACERNKQKWEATHLIDNSEYIYIYGAVGEKHGKSIYLVMNDQKRQVLKLEIEKDKYDDADILLSQTHTQTRERNARLKTKKNIMMKMNSL